jgi:hypothetical protein
MVDANHLQPTWFSLATILLRDAKSWAVTLNDIKSSDDDISSFANNTKPIYLTSASVGQ